MSGGKPATCRRSPAVLDYRLRTSALVLPVHPVHIMNFEVPGNGCANCRKEVLFAELCEQSESFQLVLYGIFELGKAKQSSMPIACNALSNSATVSPAVTSMPVTGSAATTSQRTGVGDFATASRARSLNNSALAKNKGASHRNRTNPDIRRASGYRVMS